MKQRALHRTQLALIALACAALVALPDEVAATTCVPPQFESSRKHAAFVFTGRVVRELDNRPTFTVQVQVERVFKGALPKKVEVLAGGMKGATLEKGQRYLIFARPEESGALFAHLCGGTQPISQAKAWTSKLGSGNPPSAEVAAPLSEPEPEEPPPEPAEPDAPAMELPAPTAQGTNPAPPPPAPTPTATPTRGGCGACSVGTNGPTTWPAAGVVFLAWLARRRRSRG